MQDCQLSVYKPNPRQYIASISQVGCPAKTPADMCAPAVRAGGGAAFGRHGARVVASGLNMACAACMPPRCPPVPIRAGCMHVLTPCEPAHAQMPGLEVWFQRASDVVRKLMYGDVDIGIVGYDMFVEIADQDPGLVVLHDALAFGRCSSLGFRLQGSARNSRVPCRPVITHGPAAFGSRCRLIA